MEKFKSNQEHFSKNARKKLSRAFKSGLKPEILKDFAREVVRDSKGKRVTRDKLENSFSEQGIVSEPKTM